MINATMAERLIDRGLILPIDKEYDDPRLAYIAIKRQELIDKLNDLSQEVKGLAENERMLSLRTGKVVDRE